MKIFTSILLLILTVFTPSGAIYKNSSRAYKQHVEENFYKEEPISDFTFDELVELSKTPEPKSNLKAKLEKHLSMVHIVNRNTEYKLDKPYLRVADWNIHKGYNLEEIKEILTNPSTYEKKNIANVRPKDRKRFKEELYTFSTADIICLSEVDIGMPRTKYKNIVSELSNILNSDYAYATEYIEVGPLFLKQNVDVTKYKGLHGNVIISKFPIISAKVIRMPEQYDWYRSEVAKKQPPLERFRKFGALSIFSERIMPNEVRHGSRNAIIADIKLPNDQLITVALTHLEDRAYPDQRLKQFKYLLQNIKDRKNPVILTGDFNTSTTDTKPTSMKKEIYKRVRDPHFILRATGSAFVPGLPVVPGLAAVAFSKLLQYKDPFSPHIPIIFPNHERKFYKCLKKFRFDDGNCFDLSGDRTRSSNGKRGLLANSNQRHWKGFKSTFKLEKPRVIAYYKLDWFFIKPAGKNFLPFNGRTLKSFNYSFKGHLSDHNPITVDLKL